MNKKPGYMRPYENGELKRRILKLEAICRYCALCPHRCKVDRTRSAGGFCACSVNPVVASSAPHFDEEFPLVGRYGSGTVFFSGCNLRCIYCQDYTISQMHEGSEITVGQLAEYAIRRGLTKGLSYDNK